jgi:hypothetical protein
VLVAIAQPAYLAQHITILTTKVPAHSATILLSVLSATQLNQHNAPLAPLDSIQIVTKFVPPAPHTAHLAHLITTVKLFLHSIRLAMLCTLLILLPICLQPVTRDATAVQTIIQQFA